MNAKPQHPDGQSANKNAATALYAVLFLLLTLFSALYSSSVSAEQIMLHKASPWTVETTAKKLERAIQNQGLRLFASIDQQQSAQRIGRHLPPTRVVMFDSLNDNAALIRCSQELALELPQKALVWKDKQGKVWMSWKDPGFWLTEHPSRDCLTINHRLSRLFENLTRQAAEMP